MLVSDSAFQIYFYETLFQGTDALKSLEIKGDTRRVAAHFKMSFYFNRKQSFW